LESSKDDLFTPPPRAWIADRIKKLNDLLSERTEASALALRRLTGPVTLTQESPEVGKPYFRASCRFQALNLLRVAEGGSNLLHWWRRRESNPGPQGVQSAFIHVRSRYWPNDGASWIRPRPSFQFVSLRAPGNPSTKPVLVLTPHGYQDNLTAQRPSLKPRELLHYRLQLYVARF